MSTLSYQNEFLPANVIETFNNSKLAGLEEIRSQLLIEWIKKHRGLAKKKLGETVLLDVGCGRGGESRLLAKYFGRVIGIDSSPTQITEACKFNNPDHAEFKIGSAEDMPVDDDSADVILCNWSLHYFDIDKFMQECQRALKPQGVALFYMEILTNVKFSSNGNLPSFSKEIAEMHDRCFWIAAELSHPQRHVLNCYQELYNQIEWAGKQKYEEGSIKIETTLQGLREYYFNIPFYTNLGISDANPMSKFFDRIERVLTMESADGGQVPIQACLRPVYVVLK